MNKSYLLDTHMFIWLMEKNKRIPKEIYQLLSDPDSSVYVSIITPWEIMIKKSLKKLKVPYDIKTTIKKVGFHLLPISVEHTLGIEKLPFKHKDPFDRMLISQAKTEDLILITADRNIWKYKIPLLKIE